MPTFPSYDGPPLPEVLNPLNPCHYWMLANWSYFQPSRVKQYLHRPDSALYLSGGWNKIDAVFLPAYRNLLLMVPMLAFVISALCSAPILWAASTGQSADMFYMGWATCMAGGVLLGLGGGGAAVVGGVVFGVTLGLVGSISWCVTVGEVGSEMGGLIGILVWFAVNGVAGGIAGGVAGGARGRLASSVGWCIVVAVAGGVVLGMISYATIGATFAVALGIGALRGVFYVFQFWPALLQILRTGSPVSRIARHPAFTDELAILPFPGMGRLLAAVLAYDSAAGLRACRRLLRNPFQRWAVGRGLARFLTEVPDPLSILYRALPNPLLNEYPVEPLSETDCRRWPTVQALWLGEVAGVFVDGSGGQWHTSEQLVWTATRPLRGQPHPQVAPLAQLLLQLLDEERIAEAGPDAATLEEAAMAVGGLSHGEEVALSLITLAEMADMGDLQSIAAGQESLAWLEILAEAPLRLQVLEGLRGLGDIAADVDRFCQATSPTIQAAALNRAIGMLNELAEYVEEINLPERSLLQLIVDRWQSLVAEEAGRLGERALREMAPSARRALVGGERRSALWSRPAEPFSNPYKTGDPVYPPLFVGRGDVLNRIREVWASKANPDSVILYGHRRMGKSSILRNLGEYAPAGSLLVYADLKGEAAFAEGTHHLLRGLTDAVAWAAQEQGMEVAEPSPDDYTTSSLAAPSFRQFLRQALAKLPEGASFILALDEFEAVDDGVKSGKIGPEIYDYLRSLSQEPRIVLVFAGLHTLDEMSRSYQAAFFGSYVNIHVSYLSREAAERLITRPKPDFPLNYDREVVRRIIHETHGQPLLVQRICQELVNQVNHELFDLEKEREARVLPEDLEAVLSDEFVQSETRYFEGIWNDQIAGRAAEEGVLGTLATGKTKAGDIAQATSIPAAEVVGALDYLKTRDLVVMDPADNWDLVVPLMRRWLKLRMKQG